MQLMINCNSLQCNCLTNGHVKPNTYFSVVFVFKKACCRFFFFSF